MSAIIKKDINCSILFSGSIPWFIGAEIFLQGPRDVAMSIGVTVNWIANFLVGITYPLLQVLQSVNHSLLLIIPRFKFTIYG